MRRCACERRARLLEFRKQRAVRGILTHVLFLPSNETWTPIEISVAVCVKVKIIPRFLLIGRAAAPRRVASTQLLLPRIQPVFERNNTMYRRALSDGISGEHGIPPNNHFADRHCYGTVIRGASQWHPKNAGCTVVWPLRRRVSSARTYLKGLENPVALRYLSEQRMCAIKLLLYLVLGGEPRSAQQFSRKEGGKRRERKGEERMTVRVRNRATVPQ